MALIKSTLTAGILNILTENYEGDLSVEQTAQINQFASDLSTVIDAYIKTALVSTVITGTSPSGAVTGTGTGTLS